MFGSRTEDAATWPILTNIARRLISDLCSLMRVPLNVVETGDSTRRSMILTIARRLAQLNGHPNKVGEGQRVHLFHDAPDGSSADFAAIHFR